MSVTDIVVTGETVTDVVVTETLTDVTAVSSVTNVISSTAAVTDVTTTVAVTEVTTTALPGATGPPGPPGGNYTHNQGVPATTWHVVHNLGFHPNVTVVDSGGSDVEGVVRYLDINTLEIDFTVAFGGTAYLS